MPFVAAILLLRVASAETATPALRSDAVTSLVLVCDDQNDLYRGLVAGGESIARFPTIDEAIEAAPNGAGLLLLADGYPTHRTEVTDAQLEAARQKKLNVLVE